MNKSLNNMLKTVSLCLVTCCTIRSANAEIIIQEDFRQLELHVSLLDEDFFEIHNPAGNPFADSLSQAFEAFEPVGQNRYYASGSAEVQGSLTGGAFSGSSAISGEVLFVRVEGDEKGGSVGAAYHIIRFELTTPYAFTFMGEADQSGDGGSSLSLTSIAGGTIAGEGLTAGILDAGAYVLDARSIVLAPGQATLGGGDASYSFNLSLREVPDTASSISLLACGLASLGFLRRALRLPCFSHSALETKLGTRATRP